MSIEMKFKKRQRGVAYAQLSAAGFILYQYGRSLCSFREMVHCGNLLERGLPNVVKSKNLIGVLQRHLLEEAVNKTANE